MKNLLHSSLVVASIVASQAAPAAMRQDNEPNFAKGVSKIEKQLDDLLYGDEMSMEPRKGFRDSEFRPTRKTKKTGKPRSRAQYPR